MELTSIILPIGGNVTKSSRGYGTQWGTTASGETFSRRLFNSPQQISNIFSAIRRQPTTSFAVESFDCRTFLLHIWALTCFA